MPSMWERATRQLGAGRTPHAADAHGSPLPLPQMEALLQAEARLVKMQAQVDAVDAEVRTLSAQLQQAQETGYPTIRRLGESLLDAQARLRGARERLLQQQDSFQQLIQAVHAELSLVGQQPEREEPAFRFGLEAAARMPGHPPWLPWPRRGMTP